MLLIRKDIGNNKTLLSKTDIMTNIMQDRREIDKLKLYWE